jgi:ubiquinone/menaquinone biosynthesis C-methylase UbiE
VFRLVEREAGLEGRRVLDVGCGTGRVEQALEGRARVWGVDASEGMLAVAERRGLSARFKLARAEQLPFKDSWFERTIMWLVVHLVDRPRAFAEAHRVLTPGGRLAIVTFHPDYFGRYWANRLFPSMEEIDRARFPTEGRLREELLGARFGDIRFERLSQHAVLSREKALERISRRHISTFDLLDDEEIRAGAEQAERELPDRIEYPIELLIAIAER